jgi:hypothetical protein
LLYHLLEKCSYADKIILVGGSRFEQIREYISCLPKKMKEKTVLVYNEHYCDLASGYSLYVGLKELFGRFTDIEDVLFVEGDLDIDNASFSKVAASSKNVLTYSFEPIFANKAVVLYKNGKNKYRYAFSSSHGLLRIDEPFSVMLNSGQLWKFRDAHLLEQAAEVFYEKEKDGTNLRIIQNYIDLFESSSFDLIGLSHWINCNSREDYRRILSNWKEGYK